MLSQNADLGDQLFAELAYGLRDGLAVADHGQRGLVAVVDGAPAADLLGAHAHEVGLAAQGDLFGQVGRLIAVGVVHQHAAVAVQQGVHQDLPAKHVEWGCRRR